VTARLRHQNIDRPRDRPLVSRRDGRQPFHPRDETAPFGRPERGTAESDGASPRRHPEGRAEQPAGSRAEEEEIGAVPSMPFTHPVRRTITST
jgi:hypothetical protein